MVKSTFLATFGAAATAASALLTSGHYQIRDFQNRCLDFVQGSTNDFVPVFTTPCSSAQTQIWRVILDNPNGTPTYFIGTIVGPVKVVSFAALTSNGREAIHQQLRLGDEVPPDEDTFLTQHGSQWSLFDVKGGGSWTSWAAMPSEPQIASPVTLEEEQLPPDAQQLFTFTFVSLL